MRRITAVLASSVLLLAACGGDDSTGGSAQDAAADELIQQANDQDLQPDEGCIRDKAAKLSDEDAQKIVDAGEESPDLSPEGLAIQGEAMTCVSGSSRATASARSDPTSSAPPTSTPSWRTPTGAAWPRLQRVTESGCRSTASC